MAIRIQSRPPSQLILPKTTADDPLWMAFSSRGDVLPAGPARVGRYPIINNYSEDQLLRALPDNFLFADASSNKYYPHISPTNRVGVPFSFAALPSNLDDFPSIYFPYLPVTPITFHIPNRKLFTTHAWTGVQLTRNRHYFFVLNSQGLWNFVTNRELPDDAEWYEYYMNLPNNVTSVQTSLLASGYGHDNITLGHYEDAGSTIQLGHYGFMFAFLSNYAILHRRYDAITHEWTPQHLLYDLRTYSVIVANTVTSSGSHQMVSLGMGDLVPAHYRLYSVNRIRR